MSFAVDLWAWRLDSEGETDRWRLLSEQERARADRFVFAKHRSRFIHGRARLREILAEYLGAAPENLAFTEGAHGKPRLAKNGELHFNLSHTEELAVLGVSRDIELGVDVEWVRPIKEDIAARFFSPLECATLRSLPEAVQPRAFLECWTRKEAYIKASGEGLSLPLDSFDVAFGPGQAARFLRIDSPPGQSPEDWRLHAFEPETGCVGAIAAKTSGRELVVNLVAAG